MSRCRPVTPLAWAALLAALTTPGCKRAPSYDEPLVDRSDGALPELTAPRVLPNAIVIDGKLDEQAWAGAGMSKMFVSPGSGRPAPSSKVNGRARVVWNEQDLLVAFEVWDAGPTSPFGHDDVDPHIWARASGVELMLQPGERSDNRDYFELQVDVNGAVWDTRFDDYMNPVTGGPDDASKRFGHQEWRSGVERAVEIDARRGRYVVELRVPWASLRTSAFAGPPRPGATMRANFYSFRDGQSDSLAWSPLLGQGNFHKSARFGRVHLGG